MATKNDASILKWLTMGIFILQLIFGAGILYSQHKQLIPMVAKLTEKVQENEINGDSN